MITHPEIAIGIPARIVTAKGRHKLLEAERLNYEGPLTMQDAVDCRVISQENAARYIDHWVANGGNEEAGKSMKGAL
jgi:hypothetical protein